MVYLSLYRKYRPQAFSELLGQEHVSRTLARAIEEDRVAHAYLFTGPRGTGKTSTARILAKALNCERGPTPEPCGVCASCVAIAEGSSLDVIEMDAASHSKVDDTRDILSGVPLATAGGRKKVYVVDEVHMLSTPSFNALLKTLEEPPAHVIFILATTEAHKVPSTIASRTQRFDFRRAPVDVLEDHLRTISRLENVDIEDAAVGLLARHSEGSFRDAVSALDQLSSLGGRVSAEDAERVLGSRDEDAFLDLFDAIAGGDVGSVFKVVHGLVSQGADIRQLVLGVLAHGRSLLLLKASPEAAHLLEVGEEDRVRLAAQAESFGTGALVRTLDLVGRALTEMRTSPSHRLLLEVALVRAASPETDPSATGLLGRIERLERRIGIEPPAATDASESGSPDKKPADGGLAHPDSETAAVGRSGDESPRARPVDVAAVSDAWGPASEETGSTSSRESVDEQPPAPTAAKSEASEAPSQRPPADGETTSDPAHVGLGHIKDAWAGTLAEVKKRSRRVGAFLSPSRPIAFEGGVLTVEVQHAFHADSMSQEPNRKVLEEALHAALGIRPPLAFAARGSEPAAPEKQAEEEVHDLEAGSTPHDPVELVVRGLGAEVVEERIGEQA
jgi:DNA polymerase III subunit gamma/tau